MKLVTLNSWGGRIKDEFLAFLKKHSDVDVWCLQEIYNSSKEEFFVKLGGDEKPDFSLNKNIADTLPGYVNYFCDVFHGIYGLSSFFRSNIKILATGENLIAKGDWYGYDEGYEYDRDDHHRKLQWAELQIGSKKLLLMNAHLTHRPAGKQDSSKRLKQSDSIIRFMEMFDGPKILVGDFNLLPDTESIRMIEKAGMRNLIKEYNVSSTRTSFYKKPARFADYIFVSPDVHVRDFKVLPDEISDHSPLFLDFEL